MQSYRSVDCVSRATSLVRGALAAASLCAAGCVFDTPPKPDFSPDGGPGSDAAPDSEPETLRAMTIAVTGGGESDTIDATTGLGSGIAFAGKTRTDAETDMIVGRLDGDGELAWRLTLRADGYQEATGIATNHAVLLIVGRTPHGPDDRSAPWIALLNHDGSLRAQYVLTASAAEAYAEFNGVTATSDGFLAVGRYYQGGNADALIVKLDSRGALEWARRAGGASSDEAFGAVEIDGGYAVSGQTFSAEEDTSSDGWLLALDPDGAPLWERAYIAEGGQRLSALAGIGDGDLLVVGYTYEGDNRSGLVSRVSATGEAQWTRLYSVVHDDPEADSDESFIAVAASDAGILAGGVTNVIGAEPADGWLVHIGPQGGVKEAFGWGTEGYESLNAVTARAGGFAASGYTRVDSIQEPLVVQTNMQGSESCSMQRRTNVETATNDAGWKTISTDISELVLDTTETALTVAISTAQTSSRCE